MLIRQQLITDCWQIQCTLSQIVLSRRLFFVLCSKPCLGLLFIEWFIVCLFCLFVVMGGHAFVLFVVVCIVYLFIDKCKR
ncbi:hypothetical protein F5H01DRAFT_351612 [Linnemannia elongata]|nr:hypothetical protein F5H01DRAFT_351612 [Linnemannia elongata]